MDDFGYMRYFYKKISMCSNIQITGQINKLKMIQRQPIIYTEYIFTKDM